MRVVTAEGMRSLDAAACSIFTDVELMRRAGRAIATVARGYRPGGRVVGLAGYGNNGGDAFAALAELDDSYERIAIAFDPGDRSSDARRDAQRRALASGVRLLTVGIDEYASILSGPALFLDGLLGVGARPGMSDAVRSLTRALNEQQECTVLAIDAPTGLDATTGIAEEDAIVAQVTVTLGSLKLGLLLEHARRHVGALWFDDIGIENVPTISEYGALDDRTLVNALPRRDIGIDKRTAGTPLIVAGSERFPGAAVLCARAAARAGAGYVTVAAPRSAAASLRAHLVEEVVAPFDDDPQRGAEELLELAQRHGSIAVGPGLELSDTLGATVRGLLLDSRLPAVIDAGGLFHFSKHLSLLRGKQVVLTPHAGEFAHLSGGAPPAPTQRLERLRDFTLRHGITTLLKGATTLVDDGARTHLNTTGTPALATAGTGDVLTGMIATLLAQGKAPFDAAALAAYWHGRAGQLAARRRSIGVVAGDVIDALAEALPQTSDAPSMPMRIFPNS